VRLGGRGGRPRHGNAARGCPPGVLDAGATAVTVDLRECAFIDSSGLHILIEAHKRLANSGTGLALVSANPSLLKILHLTGLDNVFAIYPSRAAASNGDGHG
jgi:anti-sigma B factor antagonist